MFSFDMYKVKATPHSSCPFVVLFIFGKRDLLTLVCRISGPL